VDLFWVASFVALGQELVLVGDGALGLFETHPEHFRVALIPVQRLNFIAA